MMLLNSYCSYQRERKEIEAENRRQAVQQAKDNYRALMGEAVQSFKITFNEFQDRHRKDPRFKVRLGVVLLSPAVW